MAKEALSDEQRQIARGWCSENGCCLRLARNIVVNGQAAETVTGCANCPVTGQNGDSRKQTAIDELVRLLEEADEAEGAEASTQGSTAKLIKEINSPKKADGTNSRIIIR